MQFHKLGLLLLHNKLVWKFDSVIEIHLLVCSWLSFSLLLGRSFQDILLPDIRAPSISICSGTIATGLTWREINEHRFRSVSGSTSELIRSKNPSIPLSLGPCLPLHPNQERVSEGETAEGTRSTRPCRSLGPSWRTVPDSPIACA